MAKEAGGSHRSDLSRTRCDRGFAPSSDVNNAGCESRGSIPRAISSFLRRVYSDAYLIKRDAAPPPASPPTIPHIPASPFPWYPPSAVDKKHATETTKRRRRRAWKKPARPARNRATRSPIQNSRTERIRSAGISREFRGNRPLFHDKVDTCRSNQSSVSLRIPRTSSVRSLSCGNGKLTRNAYNVSCAMFEFTERLFLSLSSRARGRLPLSGDYFHGQQKRRSFPHGARSNRILSRKERREM
jgi:hypothetical protein